MQRSLKKELASTTEAILRRVYEFLPERVRAGIPRAATDFARRRIVAATLVEEYDLKLRSGFSRQALVDLARIKADPGLSPRDRGNACHSLARWHAAQGDFVAALKEIEHRRGIHPASARSKQLYMLEALFLCRLGRAQEARALVERSSDGIPFDISVQLMKANTWNPAVTGVPAPEAEDKVLDLVNTIYRHFGLPEIVRRDAGAPLSIDNLCARDVRARYDPDNKVTVIVPAYNAADTITTALTSIAEQSWRNIEVLVVDDCSTDGTAGVVEAFCRTDARFDLIRQPVNRGSYACRNQALKRAGGRFVTVHDADDWAHPSRIEQQVMDLLRSTGKPYNLSRLARATPELAFFGTLSPSANLTVPNLSSLLFERAVLEKAGEWSEVRVSADSEFLKRLDIVFGGNYRDRIVSACPMAFGRYVVTSLTHSRNTHVRTINHGVRRTYHEVMDVWHASLKEIVSRGGVPVPSPDLPLPHLIKSVKAPEKRLDVVFIGDFNMSGGTYHSAMNMLRAARAAGLKAGIFQYRRYDLDVTEPLRKDLIDHALENDVRIVCAGESVDVDTVVVTHPSILNHHLDMFPKMDHRRLVVVVDEMAERDRSGRDAAYDPAAVRAHLVDYFGHEGDWAPVSGTVRALMEADARYPRPHADTWTPPIDVAEWCGRAPHWRGGERRLPVIGRHGRDHPLKWPGERAALLDAYCAGRACEVRFLGGARHARKIAGGWPGNWKACPFGSRDVKDFLSDIDVFLHYPHEDSIEAFGRAPMEAMAVGVPVILPPVFRDTFAEAALYAEPHQVWSLVERLWQDGDEWLRRVEAGRAFVRAHCSYDSFAQRLGLPSGRKGR